MGISRRYLKNASGRNLKIVGKKGVVWGKVEDSTIYVQNKLTDAVEEFKITDDGSGHGGSNRIHSDTFISMMEDPDFQGTASLEAGYLSAMLCFAADRSVEEKQQINVSDLMPQAGLKLGFQVD